MTDSLYRPATLKQSGRAPAAGALLGSLLELSPPRPGEDEFVAQSWPILERKILAQLEGSLPPHAEAYDDDVWQRVFGRSDDDSPLPDFVARRLPPIVEAVGALLGEVWLLDTRFGWVERIAGHSLERGALQRREDRLENSGLSREAGADWHAPAKLERGKYTPAVGEDQVWAPADSLQVVIALRDSGRVWGYLRAVLPATLDEVQHDECEARLYRLAQVLQHTVLGSECRRIERARDELANLGNRVTDVSTFLGEIVTEFLPRVLALRAASVFFLNEAGDGLVLARSTGLDDTQGVPSPLVYRCGVGLTGYVWRHKHSIRFPDDLSSNPQALDTYDPPPVLASLSREWLPPHARRQFLAVPLVREREVIGVLRLSGRTGEWRFSEWDEALANALASQIAQIYWHLRTIGEGLEAKATLIKTMELLQSAQTEDEMVRTVLIALTCRQGLGLNRAAFWAFDEDCRSLAPVMVIGAATEEEECALQARVTGPVEQLLKRLAGTPDLFETSLQQAFKGLGVERIDSSEDCLSWVCREPVRNRATVMNPQERPERDTKGLRCVFGDVDARVFPLWAGGSCIGCIYVDNAFGRGPIRREHEELVLAHARHLAGAIKAARESAQRRRTHEFHRRLSAALVAPGDTVSIARGIVSAIHDVLGFERILIYCHDASDGVIRPLGLHGFAPLSAITFQTGKLVRAVIPKVVSTRRPYFTEFSELDAQIDPEWRELLEMRGPLLAFPLQLGGLITGVLVINDPRVNPGTEFVLQPLADMLGVAMRTIAQDERLQAREKTVELLRRIQKDLRLAHNEEAFVNELAASLVEIIPAQLCAVYRPSTARAVQDPRTVREEAFERRGSAGYPATLRDAVRYARRGAGTGLTSHVLSGTTINVPRVDGDARWEGNEFPLLTESLGGRVRAFLGVPLLASDNRVLGGITLTRVRRSADDGLAFQSHEQQLLEGIAEGVSTVLELKDARAALEDHVEKMGAVSRMHDRLVMEAVVARSWNDVQSVAQAAADELRRVCDADLAILYGLGLAGRLTPSLSGDFWRREAVADTTPRRVERLDGSGARAYYADAATAYAGQVPDGSFADREGVVSFAHVAAGDAGGKPWISVFVNYRTVRRFPKEERQMIERVVGNCGLAVELAIRAANRQPDGLRVVRAETAS